MRGDAGALLTTGKRSRETPFSPRRTKAAMEFPLPSLEVPGSPPDVPSPSLEPPGPILSPVARLVSFAEELARVRGHQNSGFLSMKRGFLPSLDPALSLSPSHAAWDRVAAELPSLYEKAQVRRVLDALPRLSGRASELPEQDLLRGAALLAVLSHAYWYCLPVPPTRLPRAIEEPWTELRARLGRSHEVISYIDLIVYNWRRKDPNGPLIVSNLELLFPTIGNQEEQVFYLTQVEILARSGALLRAMIRAQTAVLAEDSEILERELRELALGLTQITREALPKINGRSRHPHFMDAITWAKTVAPFAVPFRNGVQGPSGTSSPIFNTLDLFFGRKRYESFLGKEIRSLRATYPPLWRALLRRIPQVDTGAYVRRVDSPVLTEAFQSALAAYAGTDGFLGRHRTKVYGFLELAFKVGRSLTIGGFGGAFCDRTWDQVDEELESSRSERDAPSGTLRVASQRTRSPGPTEGKTLADVAEHDRPEAIWVAVSGRIYDITRFREHHPGGERILDAYAGMDATHGFSRAHAGRPEAEQMLARFYLADLIEPPLSSEKRAVSLPGRGEVFQSELDLYRAYARALNLCQEMKNALTLDLSFLERPVHPGRLRETRSPYQLTRLAETHLRFLQTQLGVLYLETLPRLAALSAALLSPEPPSGAIAALRETSANERHLETLLHRERQNLEIWVKRADGGALPEETVKGLLARGEKDRELLAELARLFIAALRGFERARGNELEASLRGLQVRALVAIHAAIDLASAVDLDAEELLGPVCR